MKRKTLKERSERAARRDELYVFAKTQYAEQAVRAGARLWREGFRMGRRSRRAATK